MDCANYHPAVTPSCSAKLGSNSVPRNSIQVLNSNIQAYKRAQFPNKFGCFGKDYVNSYVDVMAFEEIDQDSELLEIVDEAPGSWLVATCGVGKDSCGPKQDTGSGMAWNTEKFVSRESKKPDAILAEPIALSNSAWGVQISTADEQGTSWGPQYRKLVYAVLDPTSAKQVPPMIFGAVHLGRRHGPQDPSGASQGKNTGETIKSAMQKNDVDVAIVCGDWNPYWDEATKAFEEVFEGYKSVSRCYDVGCDNEIHCVGVGGVFSNSCKDAGIGWVANDHPVAAVSTLFTPA